MFQLEARGPVTILRLCHGKASALDVELLEALRAALLRLQADPSVRALVLTGTGAIFCAGVDLRRLLAGGPAYVERFLPVLDGAVLDLFGLDKPVVAALNGHAIAGGCILACASDARLLAAGPARIGVPELKVGVPFPAGIVEVLRFALPAQHASDLLLRGRLCGADEALARGLVDEVVPAPELLDRAVAVAQDLSAPPPAAFAATKRRLRGAAREQGERLSRESRAATIALWSSAEVQAAVRGYVERTLGG
jgi:enoyl-CoA hydratase